MSFIDSYKSLVDFDAKNERQKKTEKKKVVKTDTIKKDNKKRSRSKSPQRKVEPVEESNNPDVPSRQFGDLYCRVCDSHMNSEQMWESHITGKRHLKSTRKGEAVEPRYEYVGEEPTIQKELDKETRPIAGLEHTCEILRTNQPPFYQCFLCSASLQTSKSLFDHIMGLKHRMAFLKEHLKEEKHIVDESTLPKSSLEPIVQDLILKYEKDHGRGKMSVKKENSKPAFFTQKKSVDNGDKQYTSSKSKHSSLSKSSKPPPKSARHSPKSPSYSPPPKSSRYSPGKSYRDFSPPKSYRDCSPPNSYRDSPPKSYRKKERNPESQWKKVSPPREMSRERMYSARSHNSDEENWKSGERDSSYYRRIPTDQDIDARLEPASKYRCALPESDAGKNCSDLRVILQQKKNFGMTSAAARANLDASTSNSNPYKIKKLSSELLELVNEMSPEVFLSITEFKLERMPIQNEIELKLLDRVAHQASTLASAVRNKVLVSRLRESLAQSGISNEGNMIPTSSQSSKFNQNLDALIGHFKDRKSTGYEDDRSKDSYYSLKTASEQYHDNQSSPRHQLYSPQYRNPSEQASTYDSGWNQRSSTTSLPFQSFSSTPASIPGLTLTEEASASSVMNQFAQTAKSIFGNINVPSTPPANTYQNEDYNRLSYRY